jgi:hypothetical protein
MILSKNCGVVVGQWVATVIVVEVPTLLEGVTAEVEPGTKYGRSGIAVERLKGTCVVGRRKEKEGEDVLKRSRSRSQVVLEEIDLLAGTERSGLERFSVFGGDLGIRTIHSHDAR